MKDFKEEELELPSEVWALIFEYLDARTLLKVLSQINSNFASFSRDILFKRMTPYVHQSLLKILSSVHSGTELTSATQAALGSHLLERPNLYEQLRALLIDRINEIHHTLSDSSRKFLDWRLELPKRQYGLPTQHQYLNQKNQSESNNNNILSEIEFSAAAEIKRDDLIFDYLQDKDDQEQDMLPSLFDGKNEANVKALGAYFSMNNKKDLQNHALTLLIEGIQGSADLIRELYLDAIKQIIPDLDDTQLLNLFYHSINSLKSNGKLNWVAIAQKISWVLPMPAMIDQTLNKNAVKKECFAQILMLIIPRLNNAGLQNDGLKELIKYLNEFNYSFDWDRENNLGDALGNFIYQLKEHQQNLFLDHLIHIMQYSSVDTKVVAIFGKLFEQFSSDQKENYLSIMEEQLSHSKTTGTHKIAIIDSLSKLMPHLNNVGQRNKAITLINFCLNEDFPGLRKSAIEALGSIFLFLGIVQRASFITLLKNHLNHVDILQKPDYIKILEKCIAHIDEPTAELDLLIQYTNIEFTDLTAIESLIQWIPILNDTQRALYLEALVAYLDNFNKENKEIAVKAIAGLITHLQKNEDIEKGLMVLISSVRSDGIHESECAEKALGRLFDNDDQNLKSLLLNVFKQFLRNLNTANPAIIRLLEKSITEQLKSNIQCEAEELIKALNRFSKNNLESAHVARDVMSSLWPSVEPILFRKHSDNIIEEDNIENNYIEDNNIERDNTAQIIIIEESSPQKSKKWARIKGN